jgi:general secretion pathway protein H
MTSRSDRRAGFTLIELLVVLAVISLLLAFVPAIGGGLGGMRFRAAARDLTAALRETQAAAFGSGREITLTIDPQRRVWRSNRDGLAHAIPPAIEALEVSVSGRTAAPTVLRLLPDGSASMAVLALAGSGRHAVISIDGFTGRIGLDD